MIFAFDVHYTSTHALAGALGFTAWDAPAPSREHTARLHEVAAYAPGRFFERELPCLLAVIDDHGLRESMELAIVDGHVWLDRGRPGLGYHLHDLLEVPVVGVAKRSYRDGVALEVLRGQSETALHVTAVGVRADWAAERVAQMHGPYRIPTLLKRVDALCRGR